MNFYLIEPYNPYCKTPRKKHPMEIAEEEALYYKMMQESLKQQQTQMDSIKHLLSQQITQQISIDEGVGAITVIQAPGEILFQVIEISRITENNVIRITEDGICRILE
jgi:hypothetical protein